jgi:hypothetical protein
MIFPQTDGTDRADKRFDYAVPSSVDLKFRGEVYHGWSIPPQRNWSICGGLVDLLERIIQRHCVFR